MSPQDDKNVYQKDEKDLFEKLNKNNKIGSNIFGLHTKAQSKNANKSFINFALNKDKTNPTKINSIPELIREFKNFKISKINYNLGAQLFAFILTFICLSTSIYIFYNLAPTQSMFTTMMILIFFIVFGTCSMIQFLIENVWFKKILSVWSTNVILLRSLVLTIFISIAYFLNMAGILSLWVILFLILLFYIYLKWLSSIGK